MICLETLYCTESYVLRFTIYSLGMYLLRSGQADDPISTANVPLMIEKRQYDIITITKYI